MTKYLCFSQFNQDDEYKQVRSNSIIIETTNPRYNIVIDQPEGLIYNEENTITGKVLDSNGKGTSCQQIQVTIQMPRDKTVIRTTSANSNGEWSISFTATRQGTYNIIAVAQSDEEHEEGTATIITTCGVKESVLTIRTDAVTYLSNSVITIFITLSDSLGNPLADKGIDIFLDNGVTPIFQRRTNNEGVLTLTTKVATIGEHYFVAKYYGESLIEPSTTNSTDCMFTIQRLDVDLTQMDTHIYPGWSLRFIAMYNKGTEVKQATFNIKITKGSTQVYNSQSVSNNEGLFATSALNLDEGEYDVLVTRSQASQSNAVNQSFKIYAHESFSEEYTPYTIENTNVDIPYQIWNNLNNISLDDGVVAKCGTNCTNNTNVLAGRNGSRNTPAPLRCSNHNIDTLGRLEILRFRVGMKIRTLSCSSDSANPLITAPTFNINNKTQNFDCSNYSGILPFKTLNYIYCDFDVSRLDSSDFDSDLVYTIFFPQNANTNTGKLEIDRIVVYVEYIPLQGEI